MALTSATMFKMFSLINDNLLLYNYQLVTLVDLKKPKQNPKRTQTKRFCTVFPTWSLENPKLSRKAQVLNTKTPPFFFN